ncbi:hypothetical protein OKW41_001537 [Paraburkholderia sp. UCT70]
MQHTRADEQIVRLRRYVREKAVALGLSARRA